MFCPCAVTYTLSATDFRPAYVKRFLIDTCLMIEPLTCDQMLRLVFQRNKIVSHSIWPQTYCTGAYESRAQENLKRWKRKNVPFVRFLFYFKFRWSRKFRRYKHFMKRTNCVIKIWITIFISALVYCLNIASTMIYILHGMKDVNYPTLRNICLQFIYY